MSATLSPGGYVLVMRCPRCHQAQEVYAVISTRLTADDEGATLRPTLHAKAVDHICGQRSILDEPDQVGTPAFDFRQRQAGEHNG